MMKFKNILFTFYFSVFSIPFIFSQNYFDNTSIWQESRSVYSPNLESHEDYKFIIDGDSLINNNTYLKVYKKGIEVTISNSFGQDTTYQDIDEIYLGIRETENKVYAIGLNGNTSEELLYDFDMVIGDTIHCSSSCILVDSISTIMFDGELRKHFFLSGTSQYGNEMIEGVGYEVGFFSKPDNALEVGSSLICYQHGNSIINVSNTENCNLIITNTENHLNETGISIYPNPFKNILNINIKTLDKCEEIQIYNLNGLLLKDFKYHDSNQTSTELNLEELNKGIYILKLLIGGNTYFHKVIK